MRNIILQKILLLTVFILSFLQNSEAQVSGTIFRDFNANGTLDAPDEVGQSGVVVVATDAAGMNLTVTYTGSGSATNATGQYAVVSANPNTVRLEFMLPDAFIFASKGTTGGTTVLFPTTATQNLAVNYPAEYCDGDPNIIVPRFVFGAPTLFPDSETATSNPFSTRVQPSFGPVSSDKIWAKQSQTGAVYGSAYSRITKKNYLAAYYKRYSGFGPGNGAANVGSTGAIYETDDAGNVTVLIDLPASETGANPHPNTVDFQKDPSWFESGKIAWGDIDISDDSKTLYAMNLFNRKLYEIDIPTKTVTNSTFIPGITGGAAFTGPTTDNDTDLRPFGVKYYKGKVYVGVVCTGESEFLTADGGAGRFNGKNPSVQGFVFSFTPGTGFNATPVTNLQLSGDDNTYTYLKTLGYLGFGYQMWIPESYFLSPTGIDSKWKDYPTYFSRPVIADIEFINDDMVIGIRDISKDLAANQDGTFFPDGVTAAGGGFGTAGAKGLVLKACKNGIGGFTIENNGQCGGVAGANSNSYYNQFITHIAGDHMGGIGVFPGKQTIVVNTQPGGNAGATAFISESTKTFDLATGINVAYNYDFGITNQNPLFGKANGLGDIEITCSIQPIEIGNRVFMDTDEDGIQDAGEMGLDGIKVELWKAGAKVTDVTTANGGQWFFTNLDEKIDYEVKILAADIPSGKSLTTANVTTNGKDLIDSDAILVGSDAVITYKTGSAGQNNHSLDFGFKVASSCNLTADATGANPTCPNNDGAIELTVNNATGAPTYLWSNGATTKDLTGLSAGTYKVTVTDGACTATDEVILEVIPSTIQYSICPGETYKLEIADNTLTGIQWKKDGVDIMGANALTYTASSVGTYTYTSNAVGGCAVGQCCPIELIASTNCCKPKICTTVKITKK